MVFECEMITKVTVRIKADDEIQAQDYMDTHTFEDIREATSDYSVEYEDKIVNYGQECDDEGYAIDITHTTYGISVKALYEKYGENLTYCKIEKNEDTDGTYYDLFNNKGMLSLMDGEEAEILTTINGTYQLIGDTYIFELTPEEFQIATFNN